jgi:hypothetical protein
LDEHIFGGIQARIRNPNLLGRPSLQFHRQFFKQHALIEVINSGTIDVVDLGDVALLM